MLYKFAVVGAVFAGIVYWVGLFDRPKFVYRDYLIASKKEMFAIMAPCKELPYSKNIPRLLYGTKNAISSLKDSSTLLAKGAALYEVPKGTERLGVGLYFDDPSEKVNPRYALGFVVGARNFAEAKNLASEANKVSDLKEKLVAVRIGPGPGLAGRIPWRIMLTPMIQPMIQWSRAFAEYEKRGYKSQGRDGEDGSIACEIYVEGPNDRGEYIDYIVLMGDTRNTWNDAFPVAN